jgi:hypothetical protein
LQPSGFTQNVQRAQRVVSGQDVILHTGISFRPLSLRDDAPAVSGLQAEPIGAWCQLHRLHGFVTTPRTIPGTDMTFPPQGAERARWAMVRYSQNET